MWTSNEVRYQRLGTVHAEKRANDARDWALPSIRNKALVGGGAGAVVGIVIGMMLMLGVVGGTAFAAFGITIPLLLGACLTGAGAIAGSFIDLLGNNNAWRSKIK
jgi:hypothetical protein